MRLTLEIEPRRQPIAGWLQPAGEPRRDFVGMLELISLLEQLRVGAPTKVEQSTRIVTTRASSGEPDRHSARTPPRAGDERRAPDVGA